MYLSTINWNTKQALLEEIFKKEVMKQQQKNIIAFFELNTEKSIRMTLTTNLPNKLI